MATKKRLHQTFDEVQKILDTVVRFDGPQALTDEQRAQTRRNIGADALIIELESASDFFHFTTDTTYDEVRAAARENRPIYFSILNGFALIAATSHTGDIDDDNFELHGSVLNKEPDDHSLGGMLFDAVFYPDGSPADITVSWLENVSATPDWAAEVGEPGYIENKPVIPSVKTGTTAYWAASGYIPASGEVIVYTDKSSKIVDGVTVYTPGIKIGSGNAYVQDLAFVGDDVADTLLQHINNTAIHVTLADKEYWNDKINVDDDAEVVDGALVFNRN